MTELDRLTASEVEAEETLRAILENLTGDPRRVDFHVDFARRYVVRLGMTSAIDYLRALACEIPQLIIDPDWRVDHHRAQTVLDNALREFVEQAGGTY